jgi:hypothetical protein
MPSRWDMPRENLPARRSAAFSRPVISSTSLTRASGSSCSRPARSGATARCVPGERPWPPAARRPRAAGCAGRGSLAADPHRAGVRPVQAEHHPHRGGLARAVRPEEPRSPCPADVES